MGDAQGKLADGEDAVMKNLEHTMEHKFIRLLFEEKLADTVYTEIVQTCMSKLKKHVYKEPAQLCTQGKPGKQIYFIVEGEAYVYGSEKFVDRDDEHMIIKILHKGDFFGEVSCVYHIPCTTTVRTSAWTTVYELRGDDLLPLLVNKDVNHMNEWFIARRYMPSHHELNQFRVQEGMTAAYLENLPVFRGWEEMPVKTVVRTLPEAPVVLYLPDTPIIFEDDPGGELTIMINGRADVFDGATKLGTVFAKQFPFVFGEEGLFNWEYSHRLSVVAQAPCHILTIPRVVIDRVCIDMSEYSEGAGALWRDWNVMWRDVLKSRNRDLYKKYAPRLQIEMLYRDLRETEVLMTCDPGLVYTLAITGIAQEYGPKQQDIIFDGISDVASSMVFVVEGRLELVQADGGKNIAYEKGSIFYKQKYMSPKAKLKATTVTLVLLFQSEMIRHLLSKYPEAHLNLGEGSQLSIKSKR